MGSAHGETFSFPAVTAPRIMVVRHGDAIRIVLLNATLPLDQIGAFQRRLESITDRLTSPQVVLDLRCCRYMPTTAIGAFVSLHARIAREHGALRIVTDIPNIRKLFVITRLDRLFSIHEAVDTALATLHEL